MKNKIKLLTVVGTRPEIIRLSAILPKFDKFFDHILIHTNQNYNFHLNDVFFNELNLRKPDYLIKNKKINNIETISNILTYIDKLIKRIKPDAFFVLGDTNSCLSAYSAKRNKVPVFHYEAGNRCFDLRVPEEINRKIIDHLSDINFTYSNISRQYLINENFSPEKIIKIGSPLKEVYLKFKNKINKSNITKKLKLKKNNFFLMSFHREENIDNNINLKKICDILYNLSTNYSKKIVLSLHPRTKKKLNELDIKLPKNVIISDPFGYLDYVKLMIDSFVVISDSGSINEEASILNIRAINLRETHERPEAMEKSSTIMCGLDIKIIDNAINILKDKKLNINLHEDYNINDVSTLIVKNILSHIEFINKNTWKKS